MAITPTLELLHKNADEYVSFAKVMAERFAGMPFRVKFAEGLSSGRNISPSKEQNQEYSKIVKLIQKQVYGVEYDLIEFVETMSNDVVLDNCMFGMFAVASNGDVYLCPEIGKLQPIANVRTTPFDEICKKSSFAESETSVSKITPCKWCELRYICGGGCRVNEYPDIAKLSFMKGSRISIKPRICNPEIKNHFFDIMIKSNEYLYMTDSEM